MEREKGSVTGSSAASVILSQGVPVKPDDDSEVCIGCIIDILHCGLNRSHCEVTVFVMIRFISSPFFSPFLPFPCCNLFTSTHLCMMLVTQRDLVGPHAWFSALACALLLGVRGAGAQEDAGAHRAQQSDIVLWPQAREVSACLIPSVPLARHPVRSLTFAASGDGCRQVGLDRSTRRAGPKSSQRSVSRTTRTIEELCWRRSTAPKPMEPSSTPRPRR